MAKEYFCEEKLEKDGCCRGGSCSSLHDWHRWNEDGKITIQDAYNILLYYEKRLPVVR